MLDASSTPKGAPVIRSDTDASAPLANMEPAVEPSPGMASALPPSVQVDAGAEPADIGLWPGLDIDPLDALAADFAYPIVLDLGGDGIEIIPLGQSRAKFDINGDGRRQFLAWVGPNDGLLVYDRDGDRVISQRDEIAFKD